MSFDFGTIPMKDADMQGLWDALMNEPLADEEKGAMRSLLLDYMREHPAKAPLHIRALDRVSLPTVFRFAQSPRLQFAFASIVVLFVAGGGTAYAANGSLPGEPLYGVKINIEEPLLGAFQNSPQAEATWNAELAARRLSEAEQMAAQGTLTPAAASQIVGGLDQATDNFDASVSQIAATSSDAAAIANIESDMEATLAANTQVLAEIVSAKPSNAPVIQPIISRAQSGTAASDSARTELDAVAQSDVAQVRAAAEAQLHADVTQLGNVTEPASSSLSAQIAQEAIQTGRANLNAGNYQAALETLQTASVAAQEAHLNQSIGGTLGVEIPSAAPGATSTNSFNTVRTEASSSSASTAAHHSIHIMTRI